MLFPRKLIGIPYDTLCSLAGEDAVLDDHLVRLTLVEPCALSCVLAFRVFADEGHIDLFRLHIFERALRSFQELDRPQIDILVKIVPDPDQQPSQGNIVRNARISHSAEKDRVIFGQDIDAVLRHHLSGLQVVLTSPGEIREGKPEASIKCGGRIQHFFAFCHDLRSDSVSRNNCDLIFFHSFLLVVRSIRTSTLTDFSCF